MENKSSRTFPGSETSAALVCCGCWSTAFRRPRRHGLLFCFLVKLPICDLGKAINRSWPPFRVQM